MDAHTESKIAGRLRTARAGRTTVVLTSSPLLLDGAERVVLIDGGTAVAVGTHQELLHGDARYHAVVTRDTEAEQEAREERDEIEEKA
ncbi:hypothetical protein SF12_05505 [Streptomyces sp. MBRL 601]|nr:hypothetical protein SF12_05505 [Streptomyces sp. MBRL 601]